MTVAIIAGIITLLGTLIAFAFKFWKSMNDKEIAAGKRVEAAKQAMKKEVPLEGQKSMDDYLNAKSDKHKR